MIALVVAAAVVLIVARIFATPGKGGSNRVARVIASGFGIVTLAVGVLLMVASVATAVFGGGRRLR